MPSQQVEVTVRSGGKVVDGPLSRPVRLLPDLTAGVVYAGGVYPLHPKDRIDLDDEPVDKVLCPTFVQQGQAIPYLRGSKAAAAKGRSKRRLAISAWYLESNRFGHYLVFDADEDTAGAVADAMVGCGLGVRRWDVSHRPSEDGVQYDWFVRLEFDGDRDECLRRIRDVLALSDRGRSPATPAQRSPSESAASPPGVDAAVAGLQELLRVTRQTLDEVTAQRTAALSHAAKAALRAEEAEARLALTEAARADEAARVATARRQVKKVRTELLELRAELSAAHAAPVLVQADTGAVKALEEQLSRAVAGQHHSETEWLSAQTRVDQLEDDNARLTATLAEKERAGDVLAGRVEDLTRQLEETSAERREAATAAGARSPRRRDNLESFLERLLPRLRLDPDSIETLLGFPKPLETVKVLVRLHDQDPGLRRERWDGPIFEVDQHIHTGEAGNAAMGRVYFQVDGAGIVHANVHRKKDRKEQQRYVRGIGQPA